MGKPKRALKKIPASKSEDAGRQFWATADLTEYVDWSKARLVRFPNLRPTSTAISVRLPDTLLTELMLLANERDVPHLSLLKAYLADCIRMERSQRPQRTGAQQCSLQMGEMDARYARAYLIARTRSWR